jgi:hypothetical protein
MPAAAAVRGLGVELDAAPDRGDRFFDPSDLSDKFHARLWAEAEPLAAVTIEPGADFKDRPILLDWVDRREGVYAAPLVFLEAGQGARARGALRWRVPDGAGKGSIFLSPAVFIGLGRDARRDFFELVELPGASRFLDYPAAILDEGAELRWSRGLFGAGVSKSRILARLEGKASRFDFHGVYVSSPGRHIEVSVTQRHEAPLTWSRSRLDAVADGDGRAVSHGRIEVAKAAAGTDAYLSSRTLTLSPRARAVSLPELAIDTNDLSASHGSTVGSVGPEELFYLGTRGLAPGDAKALIAEGVLGVILERTPPELAAEVERLIEAALAAAPGGADSAGFPDPEAPVVEGSSAGSGKAASPQRESRQEAADAETVSVRRAYGVPAADRMGARIPEGP